MAPAWSSRSRCLFPLAVAAAAIALQGCGGGGGGDKPAPTPAPEPTPAPVPGPAKPSNQTKLVPIRGVAYQAKPCNKKEGAQGGACKTDGTPPPALDFMQVGYSQQWGPQGRDDLGTIKRLGANAVRLYSSLALETQKNHGDFLDRAQELGVHVIAGFYTFGVCPDFDCFDFWKKAASAAFKNGFAKAGKWHPAIAYVVLHDKPDVLNFGGVPPPTCPEKDRAKCRVKAVLSAMDGVISAEKEANIDGSSVNLTVAWSFDAQDSIDGVVKQGEGYYGFQDMVAGTSNPDLAGYAPVIGRPALREAFDKRWVHAVDTSSPWKFMDEKISRNYKPFLPKPWMLLEFRAEGMTGTDITSNLQDMESAAKEGGPFLGSVMYTFETDETMIDPTQTYGLFALGDQAPVNVSETGPVCQEDVNTAFQTCNKWKVSCLTPTADRGEAVAKAWGGTTANHGVCPSKAAALPDFVV